MEWTYLLLGKYIEEHYESLLSYVHNQFYERAKGKSKADIENFGIENFCKECNKETATNIDIVKKITDQMGQFIDMENPYITCSNEYIESEWYLIKNIFFRNFYW